MTALMKASRLVLFVVGLDIRGSPMWRSSTRSAVRPWRCFAVSAFRRALVLLLSRPQRLALPSVPRPNGPALETPGQVREDMLIESATPVIDDARSVGLLSGRCSSVATQQPEMPEMPCKWFCPANGSCQRIPAALVSGVLSTGCHMDVAETWLLPPTR